MTRRGDQQGAVSTELAVLTPLLIGFMLLVVFAGRVAQAEGDVAHAAHEAARAASLTGNAAAAAAAGEATAAANIATGAVACRRLDVSVDTTRFDAGGDVAVTVTCRAAFADIAMLAVPGSRTFVATAVEVIDTYRADGGSVP
jgi:Flp pilus assembly protein TadG